MPCLGKTEYGGKGHLAVDTSRCRANCCTKRSPVSMRGSVSRYRARKNGSWIGRKQESMFESGTWTYISCNRRSTNFVFRRIIYPEPAGATGQHVSRWKNSQGLVEVSWSRWGQLETYSKWPKKQARTAWGFRKQYQRAKEIDSLQKVGFSRTYSEGYWQKFGNGA